MALSGSFYGTTANARIKPKLSWSAVQSVEGNYSDITATLSYSRTNTGYTTTGSWTGEITLGEKTVTGTKRISVTYQSDTVALTATFRIYHDDYGALRVNLSAKGEIDDPDDSSLKDTNISQEITLNTIPRASTISAATAAIGSRATVVIGRKAKDFKHSISYQFGTLTGWLTEDGITSQTEQRFASEVVNFLLPDSFYDQIPNSKSGVCTLICKTYQSSTLVGQKQTTFTVTTDDARCAPQLSVTAKDVSVDTLALTGNENKFIRYMSQVQCAVSATARCGATLAKLQADDKSFTGNTYTIAHIEKDTIAFSVTDSRGYSTNFVLNLDMIPYVMLTTNAYVQRTDPTSSNAQLILQGNCWKGNFGTKSNTLSYEFTIDDGAERYEQMEIKQDSTYQETTVLSDLDYRKSYKVSLVIKDQAMSVQQNITIHKGLPVFDWGEEDFHFNVPVDVPGLTIQGMSLAEYIRGIVAGG